jgi:hypothetical protein
LSQRYKRAWYQKLHRAVVIAEAGYQSRFSKDKIKREAYSAIEKMFRDNNFAGSPFGETLSSANPKFQENHKLL